MIRIGLALGLAAAAALGVAGVTVRRGEGSWSTYIDGREFPFGVSTVEVMAGRWYLEAVWGRWHS